MYSHLLSGSARFFHGSAIHNAQVSRSGSARLSMGLLPMIPKIVERVLLHVFDLLSGSARLFMGLLAMIPKIVEVGLPDCLWVCWP